MSKETEQSREAFEKATLLTDLVIWDGKKFVNSRNTNAAKAFSKRVNVRWSGWQARDAEIKQLKEENERLKVPEGWQLVPIEPTSKMRRAFQRAFDRCEDGFGEMPDSGWRFMLNAAPESGATKAAKEAKE